MNTVSKALVVTAITSVFAAGSVFAQSTYTPTPGTPKADGDQTTRSDGAKQTQKDRARSTDTTRPMDSTTDGTKSSKGEKATKDNRSPEPNEKTGSGSGIERTPSSKKQ